jgi:aldehyde:ferredoxin oxidoreductase
MGLNQKIAYVDLTNGRIHTAPIPIEVREKYVGGRGLDIYLLYNHLKEGVDALTPANVVVVSAGLLGGMPASASGWTHVVTKSAINGYLGSINLGEFFAPELRWAGFDHIVIKGRAPKPSFLFIHNSQIEIRDASSIWGKTAQDAQEILRKELQDEEIQTLCIGPAGEKLVRFASIVARYQNAGGRTGIGAVLGSKNLKAIVARGTMDVDIEFPGEALEYDKQIVRGICSTRIGQMLQHRGVRSLATTIPGATNGEDIQGKYIEENSSGMDSCFGCQLHCRHRYVIEEGAYAGAYVESPGYGSQGAWETEIGSRSIDTILTANHLASSYGLDPLEAGSLISWAMKLYERGILTDEDTDGLKLEPDNDEAAIEMMHRIGRRDGLGNSLAEGALRAAQKIGKDSEKYLTQVKGLAHCRADVLTPAMALALATATSISDDFCYRPAIDLNELPESELRKIYSRPHAYNGPLSANPWDDEGKPWLVFWHELCDMAADMMGICRLNTAFLSPDMPSFEEFSKMAYLNTGLELPAEEIWECANRTSTLERLFNLREGYTDKDDWLPDCYFNASASVGVGGKAIDSRRFKAMIDEYYRIRDWDENGVPKPELLKRLRLDEEPSHQL